MSNKWQDYTDRWRIGRGRVEHALQPGGRYAACGRSGQRYSGVRVLPFCKACERAIEAANRREGAQTAARCPHRLLRAWPDCYEDCADTTKCPHQGVA